MAANEWINGYLEAILDARAPALSDAEFHPPQVEPPDASHVDMLDVSYFNPTKYFVEEVVTSYDETDLHKTWMKVTAMRNSQERNTRMENLCWRIWHLTRRKKQFASRMLNRRIEKEQGHKDATEELTEELSDEEKVDPDTTHTGPTFTRNYSDLDVSSEPVQKKKSLYVVLISVHGLVRGEDMELGRDSDTGGQVKYVVELARALATMPEVFRVDLLTRQIASPDVDWSYGEPTEMLTNKSFDADVGNDGESSGAYIVRIPCGPRETYLHKELLWPHIQEFVDGCLTHILNMAKVLGDQINDGERYVWPHVIHGHYADAGDMAALLSGALNVPMVLTGHSLGRNKMEQLLQQGCQTKEDINSTYKIMRRIEAEELALDTAELVITSTQQEIEEQWGLYDGFDVKLERILRLRAKRGVSCHGRFMPRMVVIPPGMDFSNVIAPDAGDPVDSDLEATLSDPGLPISEPPIWSEIKRFFNNPHKPIILALSRPDPKKNITKLLKAFGECKPLRDLANLTLIMGNRDDIDEMSGANATVLTTVLKLIDKYDLYGQVAYPKHHKQSDIPDVYRLAARTKGVFINPALVEPFGLTLIEAAAHGLPMVATRNGGPLDIHRALNNGLLVDPHDEKSIADALLRLVTDRGQWVECRRNGLKNIHLFSWPQHCRTYLARIALCRMRHPQWKDESNGDLTEEAASDSLRDLNDLSLKLSIDDKLTMTNGISEILQKAAENVDTAQIVSNFKHELEKVREDFLPDENEPFRSSSLGRVISSIDSSSNKVPSIRRKRVFVVIALDLYNEHGMPDHALVSSIKEIIKATKTTIFPRSPGFVLSTALSLRETGELLCAGDLQKEFDALICSSGSELYYPSSTNAHESCNGGVDAQFFADPDYATHIEYRWGGEGLRKTMARLWNSDESNEVKGESAVIEDVEYSNSHCLCYQVKEPSEVPKVNELRKKLRMRGLRCHIIYCRNETKLHVLPLLASRAQALRYLFVRWGADLSNMFVFVGETGDTDYEEQLSGIHKTIILRGCVENGCDKLLRGGYSYHREDVIPFESPHIVRTDHGTDFEEIRNAIRKLG
ncbi:hypothetical protein GOP47_0025316 [Adiantum capillus-veneris]|uniref:Sucrose-phosphate synthase n=1 Tax=Adiantum capillus-veneris TaxID=13818 RepID=A0A9D4U0K1_ADICA|nr:hypothetical protein GOP47_0025316 [Adiantum capillus-veneris]